MKRDPYNFAPRFEQVVAFYTATDPRFYSAAGHAIDAKALAQEPATLAVEASQAIARETHAGPGSALRVVQRLARWRNEGGITYEQVAAVDELFDTVEGMAGRPTVQQVVDELVPVLRQRIEMEALREAIGSHGRGGDVSIIVEAAQKAASLGRVDLGIGTRLGIDSFAEIERARLVDKLPFDVVELDTVLNGGPPRGTLTCFLADQKGGKSLTLGHVTCAGMRRGQAVAYATLENPTHVTLARLKANLTGVPTNTLLAGDTATSRERLAALLPVLGPCFIKRFPAKTTTPADIRAWIEECERVEGRPVDLVTIDYLDKTRPPKSAAKGARDSLYSAMSDVYEETRQWAEDTGKWVVTATQSRGREGSDKKGSKPAVLGLGDEADSVEKSRIVDLFISINKRDEGKQVYFWVAGSRYTAQDVGAGPVPVDFACARIAPLVDSAGTFKDEAPTEIIW